MLIIVIILKIQLFDLVHHHNSLQLIVVVKYSFQHNYQNFVVVMYQQ
eukprot:UN08533